LLYPLGENSPISNFLKKRPAGGVHHICLEVKDIYASIAELQAKGITPLSPKPKTGMRRLIFVESVADISVLIDQVLMGNRLCFLTQRTAMVF